MPGVNLDCDISGNDSDSEVPNFHCYSDFTSSLFHSLFAKWSGKT